MMKSLRQWTQNVWTTDMQQNHSDRGGSVKPPRAQKITNLAAGWLAGYNDCFFYIREKSQINYKSSIHINRLHSLSPLVYVLQYEKDPSSKG